MAVHLGMMRAFGRASAAERDGVGELRFEKLAVAGLVGARQDIAGRVAHRGAIEIEPDASDEVTDVTFGKTSIRAGGASLDAVETSVDAATHRLSVGGPFGMRPEQRADGDSGH